jgi:hypothetical protein
MRALILQRRMRPGRDSEEGFLGEDERLATVLKQDAAALAALQVSPSALADRLRQLLDAHGWAFEAREPGPRTMTRVQFRGDEMISTEVEVEPSPRPTGEEIEIVAGPAGEVVRVAERFDVTLLHYAGWQECPWRGLGPRTCGRREVHEYSSTDWEITNRLTGRHLAGPGLIVHLIEAHGFFEGRESPYRVDPRELAEVLELGSFAVSPS